MDWWYWLKVLAGGYCMAEVLIVIAIGWRFHIVSKYERATQEGMGKQ